MIYKIKLGRDLTYNVSALLNNVNITIINLFAFLYYIFKYKDNKRWSFVGIIMSIFYSILSFILFKLLIGKYISMIIIIILSLITHGLIILMRNINNKV